MRMRNELELVGDELTTAMFFAIATGRGHAGDIIVFAATSVPIVMMVAIMLSNGGFAGMVMTFQAGTYMLRLGSAT
jgi:hypothetical protein